MYDFLRPGVRASNAAFSSGAAFSLICNSSGTTYSGAFFRGTFLSRLLDLGGFVDVIPQGQLQCRNLFGRGEFNPAARLRCSPTFWRMCFGSFSKAPLKNESA